MKPRRANPARVDGRRADLAFYLRETRSFDVAFCYLAPLVVGYEILLHGFEPGARAAYATRVRDLLWYLGDSARYCHLVLGALAVVAMILAWKRKAPIFRLFPAFLAEATLLAVLLGPIVVFIVSFGQRFVPSPPHPPSELAPALLASLGAGIYEEMLFRWIGVGAVFVALRRFARIEDRKAAAIAIFFSAAAFALFHHVGPVGEPIRAAALGFRFVAGIILGLVFCARGLGIAIYLHALYDVFFDLRGLLSAGDGA